MVLFIESYYSNHSLGASQQIDLIYLLQHMYCLSAMISMVFKKSRCVVMIRSPHLMCKLIFDTRIGASIQQIASK
jgi:hypothetical protein